MRDIRINREMAEQEFEDFLEAMDIDFDLSGQSDEDKAADMKIRDRVIRAVMHGDLIFTDAGEPVYTPWRANSGYKEPLTFHERKGKDLMAGDGKGKNSPTRQAYAMMGSMCKVEPKIFSNLAGPDIKLCEALFGLLMA